MLQDPQAEKLCHEKARGRGEERAYLIKVGSWIGADGWQGAQAAALPGLGRECRWRHGRPHAGPAPLAAPAAATSAAASGARSRLLLPSRLEPGLCIIPTRREGHRCRRRLTGYLQSSTTMLKYGFQNKVCPLNNSFSLSDMLTRWH